MLRLVLHKIVITALIFLISSNLFAATTGISYIDTYLDTFIQTASSSLFPVSKPKSSFLDQNGHIIQLSSISQSYYENSTAQELQKPPILDGEQGLCGLFATYNACCLLKACDKPDQAKKYIADITSIEAFHQWIEDNEDTMQAIKQKYGQLGAATDLPIKQWAQSSLDEQYYDEGFFEEEHNQIVDPRFSIIDYKNISKAKDDADHHDIYFANCFQRSPKPYVIVFGVNYSWIPDGHWITVVFSHSTTWVIDSNNISWVKNKQLLALDRFMREKSTPGFFNPITSLPSKAYRLYQSLKQIAHF